ncbi:MAG TPA: 30S ribosome-binding factor RbfA [Dehalococcoidia bacterium]|nr:30S ribosome-binding factor RbfA [Dehalococcoidia bacterium]
MTRRAERVSNLIRQEICELLQEHVNDPRLNALISVTKISTSPDLRNSKIYVSVLGDKEKAQDVLKGFKSAAGYFRRELSQRLTTRVVPELMFELDDSIERGVRLLNFIEQVAADDARQEDKRHTQPE